MENEVNLNHVIADLLKGHGVSVSYYKDWVVGNGILPGFSASIVSERKDEKDFTVQIDVRASLGGERVIVESFGGFGATRDEAIKDGIANFVGGSFHVMLTAFYGLTNDHAYVETWEIKGTPWKMIVSDCYLRSFESREIGIPEDLLACAETLIGTTELAEDIHWLRMYYGRVGAHDTTCEVLLDNNVWPEAQERFAKLAWPACEKFYSARMFIILQRTPRFYGTSS